MPEYFDNPGFYTKIPGAEKAGFKQLNGRMLRRQENRKRRSEAKKNKSQFREPLF